MGKIYESITELVGKTPLLEIKNYEKKHNLEARVLVKLEYCNPNQSVKDRAACAIIEEAERSGKLKKGDTIVEVTSGNTGIGLAGIAAAKGYKTRIYMQDQVSAERFKLITAFGGEVIKNSDEPVMARALQETNGDIVAAINALRSEVLSKEENVFFADQMANPENPGVHERTTGPEIWEDTDGEVDILVAGVGTGGTITGTGRYLKSKNKDIKVVALQPGPGSIPSEENPNPEKEITGVHPFEGIPKERVPYVMDMDLYDEKFEVEAADAYETTREIARIEGILVGTSAGAAIYAAGELAKRPENKGKTIVAILPDSGSRYLSTDLFE